ncbi:MAG: lipid-binding SYLF domain-containing protein [Aureliella sp.]
MQWIGRTLFIVAVAVKGTFISSTAIAQFAEESTVESATAVLSETMAIPGSAIPRSLLENAYGVAIIPRVIKGSFVIGARHGRGLLFVRDANGIWHAPVFISLTGGNIGWQVGLQSSDIVLVFKTQKSVEGLLTGKLTLGVDAAAAAGPVGREASAATDGQFQAEVYSYSRSRGLFAGVSIDGSVITVDQLSTGTYYRSPGPGQPVVVPPAALQLTQTIAMLTSPDGALRPAAEQSNLLQQHSLTQAEMLRSQLAQIAPSLFRLLDAEWTAYLSLPEFVFNGALPADKSTLDTVVQHYDLVVMDARFRDLSSRPEFQSVFGLLKHYCDSLNPTTASLNLPPPPATSSAVLPR